jgi:hypothetical protein
MNRILTLTTVFCSMSTTLALAAQPDFQSKYYAIGLCHVAPGFSYFSVDCLGQNKLQQNPVLQEDPKASAVRCEEQSPGEWAYLLTASDGKPTASWRIHCEEKTITLRSDYAAGAAPLPFLLKFNQKANHATLLGLMKPGERCMATPCVLHLPDMGSFRITCNVAGGKLDYDARRFVATPFVQVAFPPATAEHPHVEYRMEVAAIYPQLPEIAGDARYDGLRRSFLNIFQINPRVQMLANNSSSDPVPFAVFTYSDIALAAPPLAEGLTCFDLVRMTLDRYLHGAKGYGQIGYACTPSDADLVSWPTPFNALDTYPSLVIAACSYIQGAHDWEWAKTNYGKIHDWAREMMANDKDGNGLIEYPTTGNYGDQPTPSRRPANWWDMINFGHEDAFSNALAYRACRLFAEVAQKLGHQDDADFFTGKAAKLRAAYVPTFLNPATGVLAGWKSADGHLHDYWFTFVQGTAITCGLVDNKEANAIMDRLLQKMKTVGYDNFRIGLPGNLVPVRKGDYAIQESPPTQFGVPTREDGSDGFQYYENGGATGCYAYYTIKALYQLGRNEDARRIFYPMLEGYTAGEFQGFGPNGMSRDWRDWKGGCHGYEGLLVENYLALLAVLDDIKAGK